jgi:acetyl/propionyl-CoA carboxylase alpha subunit
LGEKAVAAARAVAYEGAGTVEFLLDVRDNSYYFMEMFVSRSQGVLLAD